MITESLKLSILALPNSFTIKGISDKITTWHPRNPHQELNNLTAQHIRNPNMSQMWNRTYLWTLEIESAYNNIRTTKCFHKNHTVPTRVYSAMMPRPIPLANPIQIYNKIHCKQEGNQTRSKRRYNPNEWNSGLIAHGKFMTRDNEKAGITSHIRWQSKDNWAIKGLTNTVNSIWNTKIQCQISAL